MSDYENNISTTGTDVSTLHFTSASPPPTRSSLSTWWKQFRPKLTQREGEEFSFDHPHLHNQVRPSSANSFGSNSNTAASSTALRHSTHQQRPLTTADSSIPTTIASRPQRPKLPHMSHSSSAIGAVSSSPSGNATASAVPSELGDSPIFGVPLQTSMQYANVSISLSDPSGEQFVYGHIPVVVAKCGVYLKKNATNIEGIFRLSGSARRIKELQAIFNSPPRFGKGLDWNGFNVHDAANILRRYLNNLPEPIIPLQFYEQFRDPLREYPSVLECLDVTGGGSVPNTAAKELEGNTPALTNVPTTSMGASPLQIANGLSAGTPVSGASGQMAAAPITNDLAELAINETTPVTIDDEHKTNKQQALTKEGDTTTGQPDNAVAPSNPKEAALFEDTKQAVDRYQKLIANLPQINRQLLMYILDLLSIFAAKSDENRMPASNLAAIFQPSLLSHPSHDMAPEEYQFSRAVVEFLILHSNKFLSHIEAIALQEHEESKRNGGSGNVTLGAAITTADKADPIHPPVPKRRHSKSLSSVGPLPQPSVLGSRASRVIPNQQTPVLIVPKQRVQEQEQHQESSQEKFLSTLKRSVSFTRKASKSRAGSGSSSGSAATTPRKFSNSLKQEDAVVAEHQPSQGKTDTGFEDATPVTSATLQDGFTGAAESPASELSEKRGGLSGLFSRRSKSPSKRDSNHMRSPDNISMTLSPSNPSIDQALASSPKTADVTGSPRHRLNNIFHSNHSNNSTSSLTAIDKTFSASSLDDVETDDDTLHQDGRPGRSSSRATEDSSKRNVSKWRKSLMVFNNLGSGEDVTSSHSLNSGELLPPPTISDQAGLSPSTSPGANISNSPSSRVGGWFRKMKSKEKNLGSDSEANENSS